MIRVNATYSTDSDGNEVEGTFEAKVIISSRREFARITGDIGNLDPSRIHNETKELFSKMKRYKA